MCVVTRHVSNKNIEKESLHLNLLPNNTDMVKGISEHTVYIKVNSNHYSVNVAYCHIKGKSLSLVFEYFFSFRISPKLYVNN